MEIRGGEVSPAHCTVSGPGLEQNQKNVVGQNYPISIQLRDMYGNAIPQNNLFTTGCRVFLRDDQWSGPWYEQHKEMLTT